MESKYRLGQCEKFYTLYEGKNIHHELRTRVGRFIPSNTYNKEIHVYTYISTITSRMMGRVAKITAMESPLALPLLLLLLLLLSVVVVVVGKESELHCDVGACHSTHIAGMIPKAMSPEPHVAGSDREADLCLDADMQLSKSSGEAELSAISVTAATSSGMPYWSISTSRAIGNDQTGWIDIVRGYK
jgi:hypothetical protein